MLVEPGLAIPWEIATPQWAVHSFLCKHVAKLDGTRVSQGEKENCKHYFHTRFVKAQMESGGELIRSDKPT